MKKKIILLLFVVFCVVGCADVSTRTTEKWVPKYKRGDLVTIKVDGGTGMVTHVHSDWRCYDIRYASPTGKLRYRTSTFKDFELSDIDTQGEQ